MFVSCFLSLILTKLAGSCLLFFSFLRLVFVGIDHFGMNGGKCAILVGFEGKGMHCLNRHLTQEPESISSAVTSSSKIYLLGQFKTMISKISRILLSSEMYQPHPLLFSIDFLNFDNFLCMHQLSTTTNNCPKFDKISLFLSLSRLKN